MEFDLDLDLEDLNLKSVDMESNNSQGKNISFDTNTSFRPNIREQSPNLTISTNNNDAMPSSHMGGNMDNMFNSDKEVDFGLNLLVNKKKQKPETEINKLGSDNGGNNFSNNPSPSTNMFSSSTTMPQRVNLDNTEVLQNSLFDDNMTNIDLDKELNSMNLDDIEAPKPSMSGPSLPDFGSSSAGTGNNGFGASATNSFGNNNFVIITLGIIIMVV